MFRSIKRLELYKQIIYLATYKVTVADLKCHSASYVHSSVEFVVASE